MYGVAPYPKTAAIGDAFNTYIKSLLVYKERDTKSSVEKGKEPV